MFLNGKKTYLSAGIGILIGLAYLLRLITTDQFNALVTVAGSFGLIGIRSAMEKFLTPPTIVNQHLNLTDETPVTGNVTATVGNL